MNVTILGVGYVGLPMACIMADAGHNVYGYDTNKAWVDELSSDTVYVEEPGLTSKLHHVKSTATITFGSNIRTSEAYIICVPTPLDNNNTPDLGCVYAAIDTLVPILKEDDLIIIESTVPVGTTSKCSSYVSKRRPDLESARLYYAHCPERVLPGNAISEILNNPRVVGGIDSASTQKASELYASFTQSEIVFATDREAEFAKLAENTFRDVNIALANELSRIARKESVSINKVISISNLHPRVNIHTPGIGVGGHCIPVDPWFLIYENSHNANLIKLSREINMMQEDLIANDIFALCDQGQYSNVVLSGLTYKPNVDDFRESPALRIANSVSSRIRCSTIHLVDPYASKLLSSQSHLRNQIQNSMPNLSNCLYILLVAHELLVEQLHVIRNDPSLVNVSFFCPCACD